MDYRESHKHRGDTYDATLAANPFDSYMDLWEVRYVREIVSRIFPGKIPRYLDFACGTGRLTAVIAPMATEVVGVDVSASMLKIAVEKVPSARFVLGDLTTEDHQMGSFDLISSFRFFGNAQSALRSAVLRALNPMLRKGGYLLINNHRNPLAIASLLARVRGDDSSHDPTNSTRTSKGESATATRDVSNTLTYRTLKGLLKSTGYSIVEARPIAVWQYRARLMVTAGRNPAREERLERLFGGSAWVTLAPDAVMLVRKVRDLDHIKS
jgi:SAM-dependent methyltransferase